MAWSWIRENLINTVIAVAWGDERSNSIKQLASDIYITPTNDGDGAANLSNPLEKLAPVYTGEVTGNSTTGVTVSFPLGGYTPVAATDYVVHPSWNDDPGGNGVPYAIRSTGGFSIKHAGSVTGKKIGYTVFRKTA